MITEKLRKRITSLLMVVFALIICIPNNQVYATEYEGGEYYNGGGDIASDTMPVYSSDLLTNRIGTIYKGEGFTVLKDFSVQGCIYIEYSISASPGYKRGYIRVEYDEKYSRDTGCVGTVQKTTPVYFGDDPTIYQQTGTVYANENVAVLAKNGSWVYIEYNATGGKRKRGYVWYYNLDVYNRPGRFYDLPNYPGLFREYTSGRRNVYSGPTTQYPIIGYVQDEYVEKDKYGETIYLNGNVYQAYYIEYTVVVNGISKIKSGYIF